MESIELQQIVYMQRELYAIEDKATNMVLDLHLKGDEELLEKDTKAGYDSAYRVSYWEAIQELCGDLVEELNDILAHLLTNNFRKELFNFKLAVVSRLEEVYEKEILLENANLVMTESQDLVGDYSGHWEGRYDICEWVRDMMNDIHNRGTPNFNKMKIVRYGEEIQLEN